MIKTTFLWFKRFILALWMIVLFILGMLIYSENKSLIDVNYIVWEFKDQPLGFLVCYVLLVGAVLGYITCLFQFKSREIKAAHKYNKINKELHKLQDEKLKG